MRHLARSFLLFLLLCTQRLHAEPVVETDAKARAREHYKQGLEYAVLQKYEESVFEFRKAYELSAHFSVLYNLAKVLARAGKNAEATKTFERYLAEGGDNLPPERRQEVEAELNGLFSRLAWLTLSVQPNSAQVSVDGEAVAWLPTSPLRLDNGEHTLVARSTGYCPLTRKVHLQPGERLTLTLELEAAPDAAVPRVQPKIGADSTPRTSASVSSTSYAHAPKQTSSESHAASHATLQRSIGLGLASLGVASIAVGGYYLVQHQRHLATLEGLCPGGVCPKADDQARYAQAATQAQEAGTIAAATLGTGAVAFGSGLIMWLLVPKSADRMAVTVNPASASVSWANTW